MSPRPSPSFLCGLFFLLCSFFPAICMSSSPPAHSPQGPILPQQGRHQPWKDDQHDAHPPNALPPTSAQLHNHTRAHRRGRTHPFEILEREHYAKKHNISLLVPDVVANGTQILIDSEPFFIKGVCYSPAPVGESPVSPLLLILSPSIDILYIEREMYRTLYTPWMYGCTRCVFVWVSICIQAYSYCYG